MAEVFLHQCEKSVFKIEMLEGRNCLPKHRESSIVPLVVDLGTHYKGSWVQEQADNAIDLGQVEHWGSRGWRI